MPLRLIKKVCRKIKKSLTRKKTRRKQSSNRKKTRRKQNLNRKKTRRKQRGGSFICMDDKCKKNKKFKKYLKELLDVYKSAEILQRAFDTCKEQLQCSKHIYEHTCKDVCISRYSENAKLGIRELQKLLDKFENEWNNVKEFHTNIEEPPIPVKINEYLFYPGKKHPTYYTIQWIEKYLK